MKTYFFEYLIKNDIHVDYDIYNYSLLVLKRYLTILCLVLPLAFFFAIINEVMIFIILFSILRKYLGGFHFKKNKTCLFFSVVVSIALPYLAILNFYHSLIVSIFIFSIDLFITKILGPVDHLNKRITKQEHIRYKRTALHLEFIYAILFLIFYTLNFNILASLLIFSLTFNVFSLIIATLQKTYFE